MRMAALAGSRKRTAHDKTTRSEDGNPQEAMGVLRFLREERIDRGRCLRPKCARSDTRVPPGDHAGNIRKGDFYLKRPGL